MQRTQAFPHNLGWNTTHFDTKTAAAQFNLTEVELRLLNFSPCISFCQYTSKTTKTFNALKYLQLCIISPFGFNIFSFLSSNLLDIQVKATFC